MSQNRGPRCRNCQGQAERAPGGGFYRLKTGICCQACYSEAPDNTRPRSKSKNGDKHGRHQCATCKKPLAYKECLMRGRIYCHTCAIKLCDDESNVKEEPMTTALPAVSTRIEPAYTVRQPSREHVLAALEANQPLPLPALVYPGRKDDIVLDLEQMKKFCEMGIEDFGDIPGAEVVDCGQDGNYVFIDRGSSILAVAHRDSVKACTHFGWLDINGSPTVYTPVLDDRLGCFIIYDVLTRMGYQFDLLFTEGEESGRSTAAYFKPPKGRQYNFIVEFDRKEDDVVLYQFTVKAWEEALRDARFRIGQGSFSDIAVLGRLGACAVNIGCGYRDYHSDRAHAVLNDLHEQLVKFSDFMVLHGEEAFPFDEAEAKKKSFTHTKSSYGLYEGNGHSHSSKWNDNRVATTSHRPASENVIVWDGERYLVALDEDMSYVEAGLVEPEEDEKKPSCRKCKAPVHADALFGEDHDLCAVCYGQAQSAKQTSLIEI